MRRLASAFSGVTLAALFAAAMFLLWDRLAPFPPLDGPLTASVERIVIDKSARRMTVYAGEEAIKRYDIALGFAPEGDKLREGDGKTPEGIFKVDRRNENSKFHLSLGLNYPLPEDRARAQAGGYSPGGDIMIHGQPNGSNLAAPIGYDWTAGCIAVSDTEIQELFANVAISTEVEIKP